MKYIISVFISMVLMASVVSADQPEILIAELAMDDELSASSEFVELRNESSSAISVADWTVEYLSASGSDWKVKATLEGEVQAKDNFLVSTSAAGISSDAELTSGLARSGGHIRIVNELGAEVDRVGWGTSAEPEGVAAKAGTKGQSLKRLFDEDGILVDTNDNATDFQLSDNPSPTKGAITIEPCVIPEEPDAPEVIDPLPTPPDTPKFSARILLTELLVDPVSPQTDKDDEFVEIYNPNDFSVNIEGYTLETGSEFSYSFVLPSVELNPYEYFSVYSIDTGLTLSNSGGQARILSPALDVIDVTEEYGKAEAGSSWSLVGGVWSWSEPTPNAINAEPQGESEGEVLTKREVQSIISNSNGSPPTELAARSVYEEPASVTEVNTKMLVSIGLVALGYAIYEYRSELSRGYEKLRRNLESWRQTWKKS